ncbi:MAG: glycosyltransferase family 2 protein [Paludibacteraceae bacterium]
MLYPKISIVTPNYNQVKFIEQTINSVLNQNYPNLEYIIIDGGSTDGSIEIIKKYESQLSYWISEPDNGMYDAIQKGFDRSTGDIMGWINSNDILHPDSLKKIALLFISQPAVKWIQGYPNVINETSEIIAKREPRYKIGAFLLRRYRIDFVFIQQESTYWRRDLWERAGNRISTSYRFAGDFELWIRFFKYEKLYVTNEYIGSFRKRKGQLSSINTFEYINECNSIINTYIDSLSPYSRYKLKILKLIESFLYNRLRFIYKWISLYEEIDMSSVLNLKK